MRKRRARRRRQVHKIHRGRVNRRAWRRASQRSPGFLKKMFEWALNRVLNEVERIQRGEADGNEQPGRE